MKCLGIFHPNSWYNIPLDKRTGDISSKNAVKHQFFSTNTLRLGENQLFWSSNNSVFLKTGKLLGEKEAFWQVFYQFKKTVVDVHFFASNKSVFLNIQFSAKTLGLGGFPVQISVFFLYSKCHDYRNDLFMKNTNDSTVHGVHQGYILQSIVCTNRRNHKN